MARVTRFWAFRLLSVPRFKAPRTITSSAFMAWVGFLDSWTPWPAGPPELPDSLQAPELPAPALPDTDDLGHGPDSVDSTDFLDSSALGALRRLEVLLELFSFLPVGLSGHAPLLLASSLAPGHAPLLSGDNARLRPELGWGRFFLPTLRGI